jgi:hypothetical protein
VHDGAQNAFAILTRLREQKTATTQYSDRLFANRTREYVGGQMDHNFVKQGDFPDVVHTSQSQLHLSTSSVGQIVGGPIGSQTCVPIANPVFYGLQVEPANA